MLEPFYYYDEDENSYICDLYGEKIKVGNKIAFLFDCDCGTLLKHGNIDIVMSCYKGIVFAYSSYYDKIVHDMKDALTIIRFTEQDKDKIELFNRFINCTGFIKLYYEGKINVSDLTIIKNK